MLSKALHHHDCGGASSEQMKKELQLPAAGYLKNKIVVGIPGYSRQMYSPEQVRTIQRLSLAV